MCTRHHFKQVFVHSELLREWSSNNVYTTYLNEFIAMGVITRTTGYSVGNYTKAIKFNQNYWGNDEKNILRLDKERTITTLEEAIPIVFKPEEYRALLRQNNGTKRQLEYQTKLFFG